MTKELYVSSTPHETKLATVEDDQLAEVYFERENEYTLAGSIYKGRVTRVLPGMQSAFVDIGLERDAFLYVSDFFEVEDEDEEFEPLVLQRAPEARPQPQSPHEPALPQAETGEEEPEQAAAEQGVFQPEPPTSPSRPGFPREDSERGDRGSWRGRHRGRRGRRGGRGFPDSKFARGPEESPERTEGREFGPTPGYQPIILPGESISKYPKGAEEQAEHSETRAPRPDHTESPERAEDFQRPERSTRRDFGPSSAHQPIILPGESLSKYSRGTEEHGESPRAPESRPEHTQRNDRASSEHQERPERPLRRDFGPPPGYQPIILPGESISKYQHLQSLSPTQSGTGTQATHEMPTEPLPASLETEEVAEAEESSAVERPTPQLHGETEAGVASQEERGVEAAAMPMSTREPEHESQPESSSHQPTRAEDEQRFEQMNVAGVFGGAEAAPGNGSDTVAEVESEMHTDEPAQDESATHESRTAQGPAATESHDEHRASTASHGTFEEEEIEEEESEPLGVHAHDEHMDESDFEELEEETIEPAELRASDREELAAGEATEAIEESDTEEAAEDETYEMEEGGEEEEGENGESETFIEQEESEGEEGRAEVRAPSGMAGYQQRVQRFDPERRGRGRRGGRRMRQQRRDVQRQHVMITDVLKEGQEVLIQIAKEPIGKKGARITSHIALPGRFLVYMPTVNHIGVSRKIQADEERQRLKRIVMSERENGHGGFIVRTAAEHVGEEDLRADIRFLKNLWNEIKTRSDNSKAPALIYHDLNLVERVLRDQVTADFATVWVDSETEYERVLRFANRFQPGLVRKVKLYTKETPLFEQFGIQDEINKALKSKVWLKSGGYIVINQTEALVAIDVNTGKYVGKTTRLEDTIVKTNVDAIKEIVRQIRLRDLGGIIVIDFIDMDERRNRQKVMQALEEELKHDRAPSKVLAFNDFGLVAITRKRVKQSLERTLGAPCPYCAGTAFVKSVTTVCNEIYTEMRKLRRNLSEGDVLLRVNPEVAKALKANGGKWQQELEELVGRTVIIKSDPSLHQEQFDM